MLELVRESEELRTIVENQEFVLFDPRTSIRSRDILTDGRTHRWRCSIGLRLPSLPHLNFGIGASSLDTSRTLRAQWLVPFNPEEGYVVSDEDFKLQSRRNKVKEWVEKEGFVDMPGLSLSLSAEERLTPEESEKFKRLRLILNFPDSSYEGQAEVWEATQRSGNIVFFHEFYPADGPKLAGSGPVGILGGGDGLFISLPDDLEKLQLITGIFSFI